ncbi:UBP1-associated 2A-like [Olea europaea subsp. europaea]|uniref:UBP1-associated 2A-like n=1 Tax=Olea europaea subsp. europaea TaxID=158383 RepID=A0A8S0Q8C4_OLEEU|nr:UBP1-associated 2A-like [Olea europaea subsp. europaea]
MELASAGPNAALALGAVTHLSSSVDYANRKIYISNVLVNASAQQLRGYFEKFGEIESGPTGFDPAKFKGLSAGTKSDIVKAVDGICESFAWWWVDWECTFGWFDGRLGLGAYSGVGSGGSSEAILPRLGLGAYSSASAGNGGSNGQML